MMDPLWQPNDEKEFLKDLASVLNKHSAENASNTPDFLLARYLYSALAAFNYACYHKAMYEGRSQ